MPEQQLVASISRRSRLAPWPRRMTWSMACVLPLCGIPAAAFAQSAPAALRACAAEADSAKRLACYDREMARLQAAPQQAAGAAKPDLAATPAAAPAPTPNATSAAAPAPAPAPSATPAAAAATASAASAAAAQPASSAPVQAPQAPARAVEAAPPGGETAPSRMSSWKKIFSGGAAWHLTAQVTTLDRSAGAMVLHLDNGQVWRQVGRVSGDLTLHEGDSVTIERHLGSYWLSSRYVSNMQVRLDPQASR